MSNINVNVKFTEEYKKLEVIKNQIINDPDFLPVKDIEGYTYDKETVETEFADIKDKKFTIAVCGEVKAGKSTLLNALLFGDNILPTFDTPLTAKLTFIEKSEEPGQQYFIPNFYSQEEWSEVNKAYAVNEQSKREFDARIQNSGEKFGVYDNVIGSEGAKIYDLNALEEYVSAPKVGVNSGNSGKYTPFVKDVHIYLDDEVLNNLQIVDTPGLNDPNPINSSETKRWVSNAHAIIYLFPKRGCGAFDKEFFKEHLCAKTENSRIFVLNQIDSLNKESDVSLVLNNIKSLGRDPEFATEHLFGLNETVLAISGMFELIKQKQDKGIELSEDEEYYLDECSFDPSKINGKNPLAELRRLIGEKLYANSGASRVESLKQSLTHLYDLKIAELNGQKLQIEGTIANFKEAETPDDLKKKIENCGKNYSDFKAASESILEDKILKKIDNFVGEYNTFISETKGNTKITIVNSISSAMGDDNYTSVQKWIIGNWEKLFTTAINQLERKKREIDEDYSKYLTTEYNILCLRCNIQDAVFNQFLHGVTSFPGKSNVISLPELDEIYPDNAFTNWFHNNKSLAKEIIDKANEKADVIFKLMPQTDSSYLNTSLKNTAKAVETSIVDYLSEQRNKMVELQKDFSSKHKQMVEYENQCNSIEININKYKQAKMII